MASAQSKQCARCRQVQPASQFHRRRASADGLQPRCKACAKQHRHAYYVARQQGNPAEQARARVRYARWAERHKGDPNTTQSRQRREARWRARHKDEPDWQERKRAKNQRYYQRHRSRIRQNVAQYAAANREKLRPAKVANWRRYRARKANAPVNDLTRVQWDAVKQHYGHRCVYCGNKPKRLTMDHLTPLSKGGSHTATNVVPACLSCNSAKQDRAPLVPVQPLLLLSKD